MTYSLRRALPLAACALPLLAAACASSPHPTSMAGKPVAAPVSESDAILALLDQGDEAGASKRLKAALKRAPNDPSLMLLRDSIAGDAKAALGPQSYPYTVQPGDTMEGLAQRFLGNRLKAYQLAKYNGVAKPAALAPGQVIRIPGEPPRRPEPPRPTEPAPAPARTPSKPRGATKPAAAKPAAPTPQPTAAANPAAARQARAAGLAALNQGRVGPAVALLQRAAALDPGNPLIARDLARAERIAATVRSRR